MRHSTRRIPSQIIILYEPLAYQSWQVRVVESILLYLDTDGTNSGKIVPFMTPLRGPVETDKILLIFHL